MTIWKIDFAVNADYVILLHHDGSILFPCLLSESPTVWTIGGRCRRSLGDPSVLQPELGMAVSASCWNRLPRKGASQVQHVCHCEYALMRCTTGTGRLRRGQENVHTTDRIPLSIFGGEQVCRLLRTTRRMFRCHYYGDSGDSAIMRIAGFELGDSLQIHSCSTGVIQGTEPVALVGLETYVQNQSLVHGNFDKSKSCSTCGTRLSGFGSDSASDRHARLKNGFNLPRPLSSRSAQTGLRMTR